MIKNSVKIGSRYIGGDNPCYLIAEVGTTCMGDIENAISLVEIAKSAGVDAIKFQVIDPDQMANSNATYRVVHNGIEVDHLSRLGLAY